MIAVTISAIRESPIYCPLLRLGSRIVACRIRWAISATVLRTHYTVRIDSTPAYTALSVCTAFVPLFIYVALWYSLLDNRPGALRLRRRRHMRSTAWLPIDRKSNWRGAMITTSSELVMHNADAKCSHNSSHLERVQQLTVPRFWAIFLDRSAVGQLSAKGPCHFWSIDFQCWFTSSRWFDVVYTIDVV